MPAVVGVDPQVKSRMTRGSPAAVYIDTVLLIIPAHPGTDFANPTTNDSVKSVFVGASTALRLNIRAPRVDTSMCRSCGQHADQQQHGDDLDKDQRDDHQRMASEILFGPGNR
jgi:hypothetical protein